MIHKKYLSPSTLLAALLYVAPFATALHAQNPDADRPHPPHGPPPSPLFDALDANHDGVISSDEIANASTALKALLKNGATQITREDVRPPRPPAPREGRERDEQGPPRVHPGADGYRPHQGPPRDDSAPDEPRPPRDREDADRAERPFHGPPHHAPGDADPEDRPAPPSADAGRAGEDFGQVRPMHRQAPPSPLFDALDANHDGVISSDEIANAPEALKKLDKSGSGQIKREDLRPVFPPPDDR